MALAKITLKLGKKTIELTEKEFEELKQDMRELDKNHYYYWYDYRPIWYGADITSKPVLYSNSPETTVTSGSPPPDFHGNTLSYSAA